MPSLSMAARMDVVSPAVQFEFSSDRIELRLAGHGGAAPGRWREDGQAVAQRIDVGLRTVAHQNTTLPGSRRDGRRSRRSM